MRRGCLSGVIVMLGICLVGCGLLYFVGVPRIRDSAQDGIRDALSTEVARQIPAGVNGTAEPGTHTITAAELQSGLTENFTVTNVDDIIIRITPAGFEFGLTASGRPESTYSGTPDVENGRLRMTNMEASDGFLNFFFPADDLGEAIEQAVNNYLVENNLRLASIELTDGAFTMETVPAN